MGSDRTVKAYSNNRYVQKLCIHKARKQHSRENHNI